MAAVPEGLLHSTAAGPPAAKPVPLTFAGLDTPPAATAEAVYSGVLSWAANEAIAMQTRLECSAAQLQALRLAAAWGEVGQHETDLLGVLASLEAVTS